MRIVLLTPIHLPEQMRPDVFNLYCWGSYQRSIQEWLDGNKPVNWLENVSDEQYSAPNVNP